MKEHDLQAKIPRELTGLMAPHKDTVTGSDRTERPLSMAWISDDLLAETIEVWSASYGRQLSEQEAVEILMNVKRLGEFMLTWCKEDTNS